jgi:hypothetical protein
VRVTLGITSIILLCTFPGFSQVNISISSDLNYLQDGVEYNPAYGFSASLEIPMSQFGSTGIIYKYLRGTSQYKQIIDQKEIGFSENTFSAFYSYKAFSYKSFSTSSRLSLGWKKFKRTGYIVDLGAAGSFPIASFSENYFQLGVGLVFDQKINRYASVFILPEIAMYDFNRFSKILSLSGGINVSIN